MEDLQQKIIELMDLFDEGEVTTADKIDRPERALEKEAYDDFMKRNPMAGGGMLVQPSADGSRPGYASDYSPEERKQQVEKGERIYETYKGKRVLGLNADQKKWYNKTHKNNPNSRFYKKDWNELGGKKSDLLDSYFNEQKREKPPKGYITTKEFSKKYGFPIYEKRQYGPVTKSESNFINNAIMKTIGEKDASKGRKNLFLKKFLFDTLEPKQFDTLIDLGDGKKSVQKVNYVKDNAALAKKVRTYIDSPSIDPKTIENINFVLGNKKIKSLFNKGDYKGLVKALGEVENLTNSERANVMLRVSQAMSGVNFRDFNHNIKANKVSAKKIFKGLETGRAGIPTEYNDAYKKLKHNTIKDAIGEGYFTKSYQGFIDDSRAALKKAGIDITNIDLNEITGLSSGYKNQTFSSTQFINFMDKTFNQGAHASMIGEYSRYETALQTALKNGTVDFKGKTFTPRQLINDWQQWRSGWYDRLDSKYKTKAVRDILPTFTLGKDPYASVISKKRLAELSGLNLNIREEGIKAGYAKTFPTIGSQPVLKEAVNVKKGSPLFKKLMKFCPKSSGGEAGVCTLEEAMDGLVSESKQLQSGNMNEAQAKKTAQKIRAVTRVGTGSTLMGLLGPYGIAGEVVIDGAFMANNMLDGGDTYKEALSKSLIKYAMPKDARERLEKETDLNTMILGSDTKGLAADFVDALKKDEDLKQKYENYLRVNQEDMSSLQDPYSSATTPMFSTADKNKALRELMQALERSDPTYGKNIYDVMKFGSPEQQAFATKQEVFDAQKMQNRMDYDRKILGPLKDLFGTGFYSPAQLKQLELKADRDTKAIGQIPDELKTQQIADFGGVANLAKGGRAGYKTGSVRKGVLSLIDEGIKKTPKDTTTRLDKLIKETLDEDFFDKKDRIVDTLNAKIARERKNFPYNQQVFEEPSQLDFYDAITKSNFRTKTGPFFDYQKRKNKAGGGLLKQAGDRSGPPPESGPNPQGLQGLLNRVKKA